MRMVNVLLMLVVMVSFAVSPVQAQNTPQKLWPLPNVWGAELPLPEDAEKKVRTSGVYADPQGDVQIIYFYSLPPINPKNALDSISGTRVFSFFKNETIKEWTHPNSRELQKLYKTGKKYFPIKDYVRDNSLKKLRYLNFIDYSHKPPREPLNDGAWIERHLAGGSARCGQPFGSTIVKYDALGKELFNRAFVRLADGKVAFQSNSICEIMEGRDTVYLHSKNAGFHIYELQDGTYLLLMRTSEVIRVNTDFQSPYLDNHPELMWVDGPTVWRWYEEGKRKGLNNQRSYKKGTPFPYWLEFIDSYVTKRLRALRNQQRGTGQ